LADGLKVGQSVTVHTNIGGREYNGKFYPSITGWKVDQHVETGPQPTVAEDNDPPF
jgi:hypothetical protein